MTKFTNFYTYTYKKSNDKDKVTYFVTESSSNMKIFLHLLQYNWLCLLCWEFTKKYDKRQVFFRECVCLSGESLNKFLIEIYKKKYIKICFKMIKKSAFLYDFDLYDIHTYISIRAKNKICERTDSRTILHFFQIWKKMHLKCYNCWILKFKVNFLNFVCV